MYPFALYLVQKSKNRIKVSIIKIVIFLMVILSSKNCLASKESKSSKNLVNLKSQSAKIFYCKNFAVNWKELFINKYKIQDNELVENKEQVEDKTGCACSRKLARISLLEGHEKTYVLAEKNNEINNKLNDKKLGDIKLKDSLALEQKRKIVYLDKKIDFNNLVNNKDNENMVLLNKGEFLKGTNKERAVLTDYEKPANFEYVNNKFYLDKYEVSNFNFSLFILSTEYRTDAEFLNSSFVFEGLINANKKNKIKSHVHYNKLNTVTQVPWWFELEGVNWFKLDDDKNLFKLDIKELIWKFNNEFRLKHPKKDDRNKVLKNFSKWIKKYTNKIELLMHPVVHVSWTDAFNYCQWAGKRLPTENEWEYACKYEQNGKDVDYPWGDDLNPNNTYFANIWQGIFPTKNTEKDGFYGTCNVASLKEQTKSGFKHLIGNVWEWTLDDWSVKRRKEILKPINSIKQKVKKGGSFLCHDSYCNRFRCSSRAFATVSTSASNLGRLIIGLDLFPVCKRWLRVSSETLILKKLQITQ